MHAGWDSSSNAGAGAGQGQGRDVQFLSGKDLRLNSEGNSLTMAMQIVPQSSLLYVRLNVSASQA